MAAVCVVAMAGALFAQETVSETPEPTVKRYVGEITGNDVYVRSGPSTNHYPVTKLDAGTKVQVHRVVNGWCEIDPPLGCFSLVHRNFVDVGAEGTPGVINGQKVLVRAGSSLTADLYARQLKLNRGDEVQVLGSHNDDYLRIVPPTGAHLYVSEKLVAHVADGNLDMTIAALTGDPEPAKPNPSPTSQTSPASQPKQNAANPKTADRTVKQPGGTSSASRDGGRKSEDVSGHTGLSVMEASLKEEIEKPVEHRDYDRLIEGFKRIADKDTSDQARAVAKSRIMQLEHAAAAQKSLLELRAMGEDLSSDRNEAMRERTLIKPPPRPIGRGFDAVGELRVSMLYGTASSPKRFRLVSTGEKPRTIGYVEIPDALSLDMQEYLGRKVGVRARDKRLQTGDVDPVVIYVAQELVVLDSNEP